MDGEWTTDPDGRSGCQETIVGYCQDMYPESEYAYQAGPRRIDTWRAAGNQGEYSASKPAYHCVSYQVDHDESDYDVSLLSIDQRVAPGDYNASVGSDNVALEEGETTQEDGYNVTVTEVGENSVRVRFGAEDKIVPKYHGTTFDVGGSRYKISLLRTGR